MFGAEASLGCFALFSTDAKSLVSVASGLYFPPFEVAQAVEYIDATGDALPSRELKYPANINAESTFQGEILDLRG